MLLLKIAIVGTRGIPNCYGGFEQLAQHLAEGLVLRGHDVTVYCSHTHPYKEKLYGAVKLRHCFDGEKSIGPMGQFIYDLNCIRDARKQKFDVLLFLGYTSSSIWKNIFPKDAVIISNMDGLEWKRTKYSKPVKYFLQYAEKLAVKHSDFLIADSVAIQQYLYAKYKCASEYIAYGATILKNEQEELLSDYNLCKEQYFMIMARMEPENNIEMILDGFNGLEDEKKMIVVGNTDNKFGKKMKEKYKSNSKILFIGGEYDPEILHTLKHNCAVYFHGHSVGGTNPSLLEAMASRALIAAHDNVFNRAILGDNAFYFANSGEVCESMKGFTNDERTHTMVKNNLSAIMEKFTWNRVIGQYNNFIMECFKMKKC